MVRIKPPGLPEPGRVVDEATRNEAHPVLVTFDESFAELGNFAGTTTVPKWLGYLPEADLRCIVGVALEASLVTHGKLDLLMQRLPQAFVTCLDHHESPPGLRLAAQLRQMNKVRRLQSGEIPIATFLSALIEYSADAAACALLEELLGKVERCDPPAPQGVEPYVPLERTVPTTCPLASVVIPSGSTFSHAAMVMARVDRKSVVLSGFSAVEELERIRRVDIAVANATEGLLALQDYVPKGSVRRYTVKTEGARFVLIIEETR